MFGPPGARKQEKTKKLKENDLENYLLVRFFIVFRSNFNTREFNSRELFWFFGHNLAPHHAFLTKIGGMKAISVPDLSKPKFSRSNRGKINIFEKPKKFSDY